jgi:hypothetical protein
VSNHHVGPLWGCGSLRHRPVCRDVRRFGKVVNSPGNYWVVAIVGQKFGLIGQQCGLWPIGFDHDPLGERRGIGDAAGADQAVDHARLWTGAP